MQFRKANRKKQKLRLAICGVTGSGKTKSALRIAQGLGQRIGVIDSERESSELYSDECDFDVLCLNDHHPRKYVEAIKAAEEAGFDVLIIDSLSHAWMGNDGALELIDKAASRQQGANKFTLWREVTPHHNALVNALLDFPGHLIVTMRSKMAYELVENERGKKVPMKLGLQPQQRDGLEYEFTLVADMDMQHRFIVSKTRCSDFDDAVIHKPGPEVGKRLLAWLEKGVVDERKEKRRVWEQVLALRKTLGDELYHETVGPDWKPKDIDDAKSRLAELRAAKDRLDDDAPAWGDEPPPLDYPPDQPGVEDDSGATPEERAEMYREVAGGAVG